MTMSPGASAAPVVAQLERLGARIDALQIDESQTERSLVAEIKIPERASGAEIADGVQELDEVRRVEWTA